MSKAGLRPVGYSSDSMASSIAKQYDQPWLVKSNATSPLGKGDTPCGLNFDRDDCENTTFAPQEVCGHTVGVAFAKGESAE